MEKIMMADEKNQQYSSCKWGSLESERENNKMNNKIVVCLGRGGQRDMAEDVYKRQDRKNAYKKGT